MLAQIDQFYITATAAAPAARFLSAHKCMRRPQVGPTPLPLAASTSTSTATSTSTSNFTSTSKPKTRPPAPLSPPSAYRWRVKRAILLRPARRLIGAMNRAPSGAESRIYVPNARPTPESTTPTKLGPPSSRVSRASRAADANDNHFGPELCWPPQGWTAGRTDGRAARGLSEREEGERAAKTCLIDCLIISIELRKRTASLLADDVVSAWRPGERSPLEFGRRR